MSKKVYLAGPMTGIAEHNFPLFHAVAKKLRDAGYQVFNPAENKSHEGYGYSEYMALDLPEVCKCDMVVFLPGWTGSVGAMLEFHTATVCGKECVEWRLLRHELEEAR